MAFIADDLLLGPVKFVKWIAEKVMEVAERELTDEGGVQEEILGLQILYEMGEMTDEEYQVREDRLMKELESIRRYKEEVPEP